MRTVGWPGCSYCVGCRGGFRLQDDTVIAHLCHHSCTQAGLPLIPAWLHSTTHSTTQHDTQHNSHAVCSLAWHYFVLFCNGFSRRGKILGSEPKPEVLAELPSGPPPLSPAPQPSLRRELYAMSLPQCPSGAACPWVTDDAHADEYSHPCPHGRTCSLLIDPSHLRRFSHGGGKGAAPPTPPAPAAHTPRVAHRGVRCDRCHVSPIRGYRYKYACAFERAVWCDTV